jgi:hypothetical protein
LSGYSSNRQVGEKDNQKAECEKQVFFNHVPVNEESLVVLVNSCLLKFE